MSTPAGYQLHVETWENDGDNHETKIISGLTSADVVFYLDIVSKFKSRNNQRTPGLGNGAVTEEQLDSVIETALKNNSSISPNIRNDWKECLGNPDQIYGNLTEQLLGHGDDSYDGNCSYFCRVFEAFRVFYFPQEVNEVTEEFI